MVWVRRGRSCPAGSLVFSGAVWVCVALGPGGLGRPGLLPFRGRCLLGLGARAVVGLVLSTAWALSRSLLLWAFRCCRTFSFSGFCLRSWCFRSHGSASTPAQFPWVFAFSLPFPFFSFSGTVRSCPCARGPFSALGLPRGRSLSVWDCLCWARGPFPRGWVWLAVWWCRPLPWLASLRGRLSPGSRARCARFPASPLFPSPLLDRAWRLLTPSPF